MPKLIGTHEGRILGYMLGELVEAFGLDEVENVVTTALGTFRRLFANPAAMARVHASVEQNQETIAAAVNDAHKRGSS